jgi:hypothetical protein
VQHGGVIFLVEGRSRWADVDDHVRERGRFTDVVATGAWALPTRSVALLSFDRQSVSAAAVMHRGPRVATYKRRVRFEPVLEFQPLDLQQVESLMPARVRGNLGIGFNPPRTWDFVLEALRRLRPAFSNQLDELVRRATYREVQRPPAYEIVAEEKDAVGIALQAAGFDRAHIAQWTAPDEPAPYLQGLSRVSLREDTLIQNDASLMPGWEQLGRDIVGAATFTRRPFARVGPERLTVMNVNRTSVEHNLGVDLLYYHHNYRLFALVQYKRLRRKSNGDGYDGADDRELVYRPDGDDNLTRELARMRQIGIAEFAPQSTGEFRLYAGTCYIKLCKPFIFDPTETDLIQGMYLPLDIGIKFAPPTLLAAREGGSCCHTIGSRGTSTTRFLSNCFRTGGSALVDWILVASPMRSGRLWQTNAP